MLAALGIVPARKPEIHQSVQIDVSHREYVAATATVSTIGATKFLVLFVTKRHAPGPAIACGDVNEGFVNEFHTGSNIKIVSPLEIRFPGCASLASPKSNFQKPLGCP
jgi:hypothetical protein